MMQDYDLSTASGKQAFQRWIVELIRNEVNSYVRQVLFDVSAANVSSPSVGDAKPGGGTYSADEVQNLRLERLEQAIFRG
jgi:hypothetical protein